MNSGKVLAVVVKAMPSVFKVLDHVHHGLRVFRQLQLLCPVLGDLKHLEGDLCCDLTTKKMVRIKK